MHQINGKPCPHMTTLISALSDGSLRGLARWYAEQHARGCPRCAAALDALRQQRQRLRALGMPAPTEADTATTAPSPHALALSPERRAALEAAWAGLDENN